MSGRTELTEEEYSYTRLVGSIGWPDGTWPSSVVYNVVFQALGLNWRHVTLPVLNGHLRPALLGLRALGFAGAELTRPYQGEACHHVEELSPAAEAMGAVKHVTVTEDGRLLGDNVRWRAFLEVLRTVTPSLNGLRPLVIGAGEAAECVVYALALAGLPLTVVDGHIERAIDLVHRLRHVLDEHSFSVYRWPFDLARLAPDANLVINTTDIGRGADSDSSPWPDHLPFSPDALVVDLVSWPNDTRLLRQAQSYGARTINALSLLVHEAALALEMWTGQRPPIELIWQAFLETQLKRSACRATWCGDERRLALSHCRL